MVKHAIICKIKLWYYEYGYYETHFYTRMEAIRKPKKKIGKIKNILTLVIIILCICVYVIVYIIVIIIIGRNINFLRLSLAN
jgi:hypothetical protein